MKKILFLIIVSATVFILTGNTNAALIDYGNGLIYDTGLKVTWYDYSYYGTWSQADAWATGLNVGGVTGWRLPQALPVNGSTYNYNFSYNGSTDWGFNISAPGSAYQGGTGNEMAYLYYVDLGNKGYFDINGNPQTGYGLVNKGPFKNLQGQPSDAYYWSGTSFTTNPQIAFLFSFYSTTGNDAGSQGGGAKTIEPGGIDYFALAVRNGNVGGPSVKPNSPYILTLKLGNTFSFDYYWEMGINPPPYQQGYMFDVLALQAGIGWQYIGQIDAYGSSTGWNTAMLNVPQNMQGTDTQIRFVLTDYDPQTDPTVYLNNITSVPEPSLMVLLGISVLSLAGLKRWWRE